MTRGGDAMEVMEQLVDMVIGNNFRLSTYKITQVNRLPRQLVMRRVNVWSTSKRGWKESVEGDWYTTDDGWRPGDWDGLMRYDILISNLESVGASSSNLQVGACIQSDEIHEKNLSECNIKSTIWSSSLFAFLFLSHQIVALLRHSRCMQTVSPTRLRTRGSFR